MKAYFTVEAVLILPITFGIYLMIIYGMFFQYDRCMLEQELATLAMKGTVLSAESNEEIIKELQKLASEMDRNKFLTFQYEYLSAKINQNKLIIEGNGQIRMPFEMLRKWVQGESLQIKTSYTNHRISPVMIIRTCRKLLQGS